MGNVTNIVAVLLPSESAVRSSTVHVIIVSIGAVYSDSACLGKGSEAQRINHTTLIALASYEFTDCSPNPDGELDLVAATNRAVASHAGVLHLCEWIFDRNKVSFARGLAQHVDLGLCKKCHSLSDNNAWLQEVK